MGLLSRTPKSSIEEYSVEEFCQHFYESQIFNPNMGGMDGGLAWWKNAYNSIVEADKSFKSVAFSKFQAEMNALRMELFAVAWFEKLRLKRYAVAQSFFTRNYLQEKGASRIWDAMGDYNKVLAVSTFLTRTGQQMGGRLGRWVVASTTARRVRMVKKWAAANIGDKQVDTFTEGDKQRLDCAIRVFNRVNVNVKRRGSVAVRALSGRLAARLGCGAGLNTEAFSRIQAHIYGFYETAREACRNAKIRA